MSNKKLGNDFEREFCQKLFDNGFWVHNFTQNHDGQPSDIIAVRNKTAYLIDCKVCSTDKGFDLTRVEENQDLSMSMWRECGNGEAWFAMQLGENIYMLPHIAISAFQTRQSTLSPKNIAEYGRTFEKWVIKCK